MISVYIKHLTFIASEERDILNTAFVIDHCGLIAVHITGVMVITEVVTNCNSMFVYSISKCIQMCSTSVFSAVVGK